MIGMSAILITGGSVWAVDADADPSLARFVDHAGRVVSHPEVPSSNWLSLHRWEWDPVRLDEDSQASRHLLARCTRRC